MDTFFEDYYERLAAMHEGMDESVDGLTTAQLDWAPGPETNSLAVVVAHTAGSERFWIGDVVAQDSSQRIRSLEFEVSGRSAVELQALLAETLDYSKSVLAGLTLLNLSEKRAVQEDQSCTVAWALLHALEHTALHLGHVQLGRQLVNKSLLLDA